jgi:hypothetical protein
VGSGRATERSKRVRLYVERESTTDSRMVDLMSMLLLPMAMVRIDGGGGFSRWQ